MIPTLLTLLTLVTLITLPFTLYAAASDSYNPAWATELGAANNPLFYEPTGSAAWLEERDIPWWQNRVVNPVADYNPALLPTGAVRLDTALDVEYTVHRTLPSWTRVTSPTGINNDYNFLPGSSYQDAQTARSAQYGFADLGLHPIDAVSADIGAEFEGNYDQRFWGPVSDENRMYNNDDHAKIVRTDVKYDDGSFLLRGFEATPMPNWINKNDLFVLYPGQLDTEYPRRDDGGGPLVPRGGQMRYKSDNAGTLEVIGGADPVWRMGPAVYAKYDAPTIGNLEQSLVYRDEKIIWTQPNDRRWALSYNSSYHNSERIDTHWGFIYQPYRLNDTYADPNTLLPDGTYRERSMREIDALGLTLRTEMKPSSVVDQVDLGYSYLGLAAGNKQQVDADTRRSFMTDWTAAAAYMYRRPLDGPVPFRTEGTVSDPGAVLSTPRGPDDPFRVDWSNREAHVLNLTLVFDPTPGTWFFKNQPNNLTADNLNPDEDAEWSGALQYTMTYYPTATDRQFYFDEEGNVIFDPPTHIGAEATSAPFSSGTGIVQWKKDRWRVIYDLSYGEALAGVGIAYDNGDITKGSTIFLQTGVTVKYDIWKAFFRYGQNVWGPDDFEIQEGLVYKHVYQAGLSAQLLKQFEVGFRFIGTRQDDDFVGEQVGLPGADTVTGAFNEYRLYATWHFSLQHNVGKALSTLGKQLPTGLPEAALVASEAEFTPDHSGPIATVTFQPHASADAGVASWHVFVRNSAGETVHKWDGQGMPDRPFIWDGLGADGKPLPAGTYQTLMQITDVYNNEATSPAISTQLKLAPTTAALTPTAAPAVEEPIKVPRGISVRSTAEGLRVTLNSLVLFDTGKADLKTTAKSQLDQVIQLLHAYPNNPLRISGYTDSVGADAFNQTLSEKRAQSVADYLQANGNIPTSRLRVVGWGRRRPVASNATAEGRQQNRRVEIDILK